MLLVPDPDTAYLDPFTKHSTLNIHCYVKDPVTGEWYSRDPRYIARKAELYLKQTGIADVSNWGPEAEFYFCGPVPFMSCLYQGLVSWGVSHQHLNYEFFGPGQELHAKVATLAV